MSGLRVVREDGYWYVEAAGTDQWWTVNDALDHVVTARGTVLKPGSRSADRIIKAVTEHQESETA